MKKITILLILIVIAKFASSQFVLTPDTIRANVGSEWKYIKHVNYLEQATPISILQDSKIYTYTNFPHRFERVQKLGFHWIGDTCYNWTDKIKVVQTFGGRLIMYQYIIKSVMQLQDKTKDEQLWFYTRKAKEQGFNNVQLYGYPPVDFIITETTQSTTE